MKRLKPFETLDDAAKILNELRQERGLSAFWCADRFLANAINGDINLTILLPQKFDVAKKDGGEKYLDTPLRPSAPKGTDHFFADRPELYALSQGNSSTELKSIVSISNDGVRSVLHSVKPPMTISVSDLRISSEQLFRYIEAERPPAQAAPVRVYKKSRTNSLDAPIRMAIELAGSLETAAVFVKLRELAIKETSPFNGDVRNGILSYTDDSGEVAGLTKASLGKRLNKHSQREPKCS
ncbi:hypothetical protein NX774_09260 [Massilia agilis]|uniref:Uncharacterized protein n=1 Tax=Massilia agilis TaxID=1811226 RepID=A0ABT2D9Z1_9BURK|nr:hypothetical protein [Massilia agilis]MCS0808106.1 hypothetical protein [Massilia agilis]